MNPPATESPHLGDEPSFAALFTAEQRHFWFRHRCGVLEDVFRDLTADLADGYEVLEVGCGNGSILQVLERVCARGQVTGSELFPEGLKFARQRVRCPLVAADIYALPWASHFDVVGLFDVLEHLPEDVRALECLGAALRPGGRLVVTVPAHLALWSYADVASGHYRRYSVGGLRGVLGAAGFQVEYLTQFMAPLYPLMKAGRAVAALRNRLRKRPVDAKTMATAEFRVNPVVNAALGWALGCERPLLRSRRALPLGTSLLAVARRAAEVTPRAA